MLGAEKAAKDKYSWQHAVELAFPTHAHKTRMNGPPELLVGFWAGFARWAAIF